MRMPAPVTIGRATSDWATGEEEEASLRGDVWIFKLVER